MGKALIGGLIILLLLISRLPLIEPGIKIQWIMYLGIPLMIVMGSAGITIVTKRIEAVIGGVVMSALWPVLFDVIKSILITL